jgi:Amt family ammonium transporter
MTVTLLLALAGTAIIALLMQAALRLRVAPEVERQGLDINEHGEEGYIA